LPHKKATVNVIRSVTANRDIHIIHKQHALLCCQLSSVALDIYPSAVLRIDTVND